MSSVPLNFSLKLVSITQTPAEVTDINTFDSVSQCLVEASVIGCLENMFLGVKGLPQKVV